MQKHLSFRFLPIKNEQASKQNRNQATAFLQSKKNNKECNCLILHLHSVGKISSKGKTRLLFLQKENENSYFTMLSVPNENS